MFLAALVRIFNPYLRRPPEYFLGGANLSSINSAQRGNLPKMRGLRRLRRRLQLPGTHPLRRRDCWGRSLEMHSNRYKIPLSKASAAAAAERASERHPRSSARCPFLSLPPSSDRSTAPFGFRVAVHAADWQGKRRTDQVCFKTQVFQ